MQASFGEGDSELPPETTRCGPPWILGERGAPLEAPENTLASLRRALDAGLDGLRYDVHLCAGGEPVVIADPRLERTTDGEGLVLEHSLPELFSLDAGGWFAKRFAGETVPHLEEALELQQPNGGVPRHLVHIHEAELAEELGPRSESWTEDARPRFLTRRRDVCSSLLEQGLQAGLLLDEAHAEDLAWARDHRVAFVATETPEGWRAEGADGEWPCERWALGLDEPEDLFDAMRRGLDGLSTREPRRALSTRTLLALAGAELESYPLSATPLIVSSDSDPARGGEWSGRWEPTVFVRNPFPHPVRVACKVFVRRGAFEVEGLPQTHELEAGEVARVSFRVHGGSWSPGGDPLFAALFEWPAEEGREAGRLLLDVPLRRERRVLASAVTQRLEMLSESPGSPRATMTICRRGAEIAVHIENPGGLVHARAVVHLAGRTWTGARTLRAHLPPGFNDLRDGLPFSCGFVGLPASGGPEVLRRWAGGVPADGDHGPPGRLIAR